MIILYAYKSLTGKGYDLFRDKKSNITTKLKNDKQCYKITFFLHTLEVKQDLQSKLRRYFKQLTNVHIFKKSFSLKYFVFLYNKQGLYKKLKYILRTIILRDDIIFSHFIFFRFEIWKSNVRRYLKKNKQIS